MWDPVVRGATAVVTVMLLAACGQDDGQHGEMPAPRWMLGVFSSLGPGVSPTSDSLTRFYVEEDGTVRVERVDSGGVIAEHVRAWEHRGEDTIAMFPAEDEAAEPWWWSGS